MNDKDFGKRNHDEPQEERKIRSVHNPRFIRCLPRDRIKVSRIYQDLIVWLLIIAGTEILGEEVCLGCRGGTLPLGKV